MFKKHAIWILILVFGVLYTTWSVKRHLFFETDAVDLGIFDQPMWHYAHFRAPRSSVKWNTYPGPNLLGDHFHPFLLFFVPFYWLGGGPITLLLFQSLFVVLATFPIYKTALKRLENKTLALAISFAYLAFIGVQTAIDFDFHPTALSVLPLALSLYFLCEEKPILYLLSFFIGLTFKEDMPLIFFTIGLFAFLKFKKYRLGILTMLISAIYYYLVVYKIIPYFKGERFAYEELDPLLGKTALDLIKTTIFKPWLTLKVLFTPILKFKTITNLFASFSFFPLFDPLSLILVLPNFASRFLTRLSQRWLIRYQYSVNLAPILAFGTIFGLENLLRGLKGLRKYLIYAASLTLVVAPLVQTIRTNCPLTRILNPKYYKMEERYKINYKLLSMIPKDASVMAQSAFVPHLTHRKKIYRYEDGLLDRDAVDYILMSADEHSDPPYLRVDLEERIENLRKNPDYREVYWDGVRLLLKLID